MDDGSALNSNIFTLDTVSDPKSLTIASNDISLAGIYTLRVTVEYLNHATVTDDASFNV